MKKYSINCTEGIYDTEYICREYKDRIVITRPFIHWRNNTGSLDFEKITWLKKTKIGEENKRIKTILNFFKKNELCDEFGCILDDFLY